MSEPKPVTPQEPKTPAPNQQVVPVPQVDLKQAQGFAQVWKKNGLTMLLDTTAIEFARDFANIVLKSLVMDGLKRAADNAAKAQQLKNAATQKAPSQQFPAANIADMRVRPEHVPPSTPGNSQIILTD